jgi:hypothetical protein
MESTPNPLPPPLPLRLRRCAPLRMDRIKRHQAKLQEAADRQGETRRRWLDTPLVERYFKQREDERAAEEVRGWWKAEGAPLPCDAT